MKNKYTLRILTTCIVLTIFQFFLWPTELKSEPCESSNNCQFHNVNIVYASTGDERIFSWMLQPADLNNADKIIFEFELYVWPNDRLVIKEFFDPNVFNWSWVPKKSGFYRVRIRACDITIIDNEPCSAWRDSTLEPVPWVVYITIKAPSGGGIE